MQYMLTQKEFDNLVSKEKYRTLEMAKNSLGLRMLNMAGRKCIHDLDKESPKYCNGCPLQEVDVEDFPGRGVCYEDWMEIIWCPLPRRYPK